MSERKQREGRPRSPVPGVAPVAVKVEDSEINKPLIDTFAVDREKVRVYWRSTIESLLFVIVCMTRVVSHTL